MFPALSGTVYDTGEQQLRVPKQLVRRVNEVQASRLA
jgi:hypothetical protein